MNFRAPRTLRKLIGWPLAILLTGAVSLTHGQDATDIPCREELTESGLRAPVDADKWQHTYAPSVFRVLVGPKDNAEFEGNAVLISLNGYFLTAAHVVKSAANASNPGANVWLERPASSAGTGAKLVSARIVFQGIPSDTPAVAGPDIALLRADGWKSDVYSKAAPLRYSGQSFNDGFFLGYIDKNSAVNKYPVTSVAIAPNDKDGPFQGQAFYGRSGSPIFDKYGLIQGIVAAFNNHAEDEINAQGLEKFAEFWDKRDRFGAAQLVPGDHWISMIPEDSADINSVIKDCTAGKIGPDDRQILWNHDSLPLYSLDHIYAACHKKKLAPPELGFAFNFALLSMMNSLCAPATALRELFGGYTAAQLADIGRYSLSTYLASAKGSGHTQLGWTASGDSSSISPQLRDALKGAPPNVALQQAQVALAASLRDLTDHGGWATLDLAKAEYEAALTTGAFSRPNNRATRNVIDALARAKRLGASDEQIAGVGTLVSVQRHDWDAAAAFSAQKALALNQRKQLSDRAAKQIANDIGRFAAKKAADGSSVNWVNQWSRLKSQPKSDTNKVLGFSVDAETVPGSEFGRLIKSRPAHDQG